MVYHRERQKYNPVFKKAKTLTDQGITLSRRGNLLLIFPEDPEAKLEISLGWKNEVVTHLRLLPNNKLAEIIATSSDQASICSWVDHKLSVLFEDVPVPTWEL